MRFVRTTRCAVIAGLAVIPAAARGDIVYFKNGWSVEGRVRREGDRIVIENRTCRASFRMELVERVEEKETDEEAFETRRKDLDPRDAEGFFRLGQWAAERGMDAEARMAWREAIEADPEHAGARAALGYVKLDGKWVSGDDLMRARGFVKWKGEWVRPEAVGGLRKAEMEREIEAIKAEAERLRLARAEIELEKARTETETERLKAESVRDKAGRSVTVYVTCRRAVKSLAPHKKGPPHQKPAPHLKGVEPRHREVPPATNPSEGGAPMLQDTGTGFSPVFRDTGTGFFPGFRAPGTGFWAGR
ncbi:MAG: hypothetical protein N3A38_07080 [Planctomycetota bacterium]|nr:hypothetical protein [Planctomycetota bacterium]